MPGHRPLGLQVHRSLLVHDTLGAMSAATPRAREGVQAPRTHTASSAALTSSPVV